MHQEGVLAKVRQQLLPQERIDGKGDQHPYADSRETPARPVYEPIQEWAGSAP